MCLCEKYSTLVLQLVLINLLTLLTKIPCHSLTIYTYLC